MRIFLCLVSVAAISFVSSCTGSRLAAEQRLFSGERAYQHVVAQLAFGARHAGSEGGRATGEYILAQLQQAGWKTETQEFVFRDVPLRNLIGKLGEGKGALIILGAHYDTRLHADQDKSRPDQSVPGANDGASGVAVLLELARSLNPSKLKHEIWLVFFDAEDHGDLDGCLLVRSPCVPNTWPWSVGAENFASQLSVSPQAVIIVDMIGDADQNIFFEQNSDANLQNELWKIAARLGFAKQFVTEHKWSMEDDHMPFVRRGIRAALLIDFDYPYWHTLEDTADKVAAASLERVGRVLQTWLEE